MGQQQNNPQKNPQTQNPGQKMPGQQDDKHRQAQRNPNDPNRAAKDPDVKAPKREHDE